MAHAFSLAALVSVASSPSRVAVASVLGFVREGSFLVVLVAVVLGLLRVATDTTLSVDGSLFLPRSPRVCRQLAVAPRRLQLRVSRGWAAHVR